MRTAFALVLAFLIATSQVAGPACLCAHPGDGHPHAPPGVAHEHAGHHSHHRSPPPQTPSSPDDHPCKCSPAQPFTVPEVEAAVAPPHETGTWLFLRDAWLAPSTADLVARAGWSHRPRPPPAAGGVCSHTPSNLPELLL